MNLDFETLRLLAWALLILSLIGYGLCEGISLGTMALLTFVSRHDPERQLLIASIAPTSFLQQAWLIAVIALLFAAWPLVYAVGFACMQPLLLVIILAWLIRPLVLIFRNAAEQIWRQRFDKLLAYGSLLAIVSLGLIAGNVIRGIPFHLDDQMHIVFLGDFWALLNPFALLIAATASSLLLFHGALFLQLDRRASYNEACRALALKAGGVFMLLFIVSGLWVSRLEGYHISSDIITHAASNPLLKFVKRGEELWMDNYQHQISLWALPVIAIISAGLGTWFCYQHKTYAAFLSSCVSIATVILTIALTLFPFILPSNRSLNTSLTLWDSSSSAGNLALLLPVIALALPLMAFISRWAYRMPNQLSQQNRSDACAAADNHNC